MREGFQSVEHVKRYTTTGMGTDQGKTSNVNALAIVAGKRGIADRGRRHHHLPPALHAGHLRRARRRRTAASCSTRSAARRATPGHVGAGRRVRGCRQLEARPLLPATRRGHARRGRARVPRGARAASACSTPARSARSTCRARTRAEFLNRVYTNAWTKLEVGRCRYGLMLRDDGMVFDDGVTARLGAGHFHMTTTTGGAARVLAWLEEWLQTEWPELEVYCTSVTEQWAAVAVVGPKAREVLRAAGTGHRPRATRRFPHLAFTRGHGRRHPGARVPDQLLRRARLRGQRALGLRRGACGRRCGRPASRSASRPTAPRPCTCCAPRRATSSSARRPTAR